MLKFINEVDITTSKTIPLKADTYTGIVLRWTGTNKASQTLGTTDLGTILVSRNGQPIVSITGDQLYALNEFLFGKPRTSSTAGDAFDFVLVLPFNLQKLNPNDFNAVPFSQHDYIEVSGLPSAKVNNGSLAIYAKTDNAPHLYTPRIFTRSETLSNEKPIYLPDANLYAILWKEPTTAPSKVILTKDELLTIDAPHEVLEALSNMEGFIESTAIGYVFMLLTKNIGYVSGSRYALQMVGGSGTLSYTTFSLTDNAVFITNPRIITPPQQVN